jgi:hypothetical protein
MDDGTVDGMDDGRTDGKFNFIPKLHDHDVAGGWTGQMMNEKSFISSRPHQTSST